METIIGDKETINLLNRLKNQFNICESIYKIILSTYLRSKNKKSDEYLKINITQVEAALKYAGYSFDSNVLNELFGSKSKNGKGYKTVKILRNEITHGIKTASVKEIINREKEIFGYMDSFINMIKGFDN